MTQVSVDKSVKERLDEVFRNIDDNLEEIAEIQVEMENNLYELERRVNSLRSSGA